MTSSQGTLVISLDFELFWGMTDAAILETYGDHVRGERTAIPRMLDLFTKYGIHATWATVGLLMARDRAELLSHLPPMHLRPKYPDERMSTYNYIEHTTLGESEADDLYHYGESLVKLILTTPHQEVANHTFSHYYAVDGGTNSDTVLEADLDAHARISGTYGVTTSSIIFPRNQVSEGALRVCSKKGMTAYRGNEDHFLYRARGYTDQNLFVRGLRLIDHYINISGHHTYKLPHADARRITNVTSSRFLRPYLPLLKVFEPLRLRRIKNAMTHAAKNGEVFHLWWHPHNFGIHQEENFKNLIDILEHFKRLQEEYGMKSASMKEMLLQPLSNELF